MSTQMFDQVNTAISNTFMDENSEVHANSKASVETIIQNEASQNINENVIILEENKNSFIKPDEKIEVKDEERAEEIEDKVENKKEKKAEEENEEKVEEKKQEKVEEKKEDKVEDKKEEKTGENQEMKVENKKEEEAEEKKEGKAEEKKEEKIGEKEKDKTDKNKNVKSKKRKHEITEDIQEQKFAEEIDEEKPKEKEKDETHFDEEYKEEYYAEETEDELYEERTSISFVEDREFETKKGSQNLDENVINLDVTNSFVLADALPKLDVQDKDIDKMQNSGFKNFMEQVGEEDTDNIITSSNYIEEEEKSEVISILEQLGLQLKEKEPIDREAFEEEYEELVKEERILTRRNYLLHKRVHDYYVKKKAPVFDAPGANIEELLEEYEENILNFRQLQIRTTREKEAVENELLDIKNLRDEQFDEMKKQFQGMLKREFEIGCKLVNTKTGKKIPTEDLERLLQRQENKSNNMDNIRLAYIKLRNSIQEIEEKIHNLETIAGAFHLIDYEQLRIEFNTKRDKVEERDEEILKLRNRISRDLLLLAHLREKINKTQKDIVGMNAQKEFEIEVITQTRKELNKLTQERDTYRTLKDELKVQTGILGYPKLLNDMEISTKSVEILREKLHNLKNRYEYDNYKLRNIRRNISILEKEIEKKNKHDYEGLDTCFHSTILHEVKMNKNKTSRNTNG